jgi:hypothetical protein
MSPALEEFANVLIEHVRDRAIQNADMLLRGEAQGPTARRWQSAGVQDAKGFVSEIAIPDVVDDTIFFILNAIDQESLHLVFVQRNGQKFDLTEDGLGELGGWFMGEWRSRSKERFANDFANGSE